MVLPGVECEAPTREVLEEGALLLAGDLVRHPENYGIDKNICMQSKNICLVPGDDGVEVARVGVLGPLVLAAELLAGHAAVLQVLRVAAAGVAPGLRPP